ncbi:MAG: type II toxin-antitoxin system CcdA family antitoxin [Geothrix sp.]|nr:type II toxin-antitoxin system CcdA family antitoxin [Geothrix sp.]
MRTIYQADAPKRPVNLSLNSDLLRLGKELGLNLSSVAEEALGYAVSARLAEQWLEENRAAMEAYNRRIAAQGVFSDGLRTF